MLTEFLDFGKQPLANSFLSSKSEFDNEPLHDLKIGFDSETGLVGQMKFPNKESMFNEQYPYRSGNSKTMPKYFKNVSENIKKKKKNVKKILEIGSNDGTFLKNWKKNQIVGVEPCTNFALETNNNGYKTYSSFWDTALAEKIIYDNGKFDIIYSASCICHISNLEETFNAVFNSLNEDGFFVFQDPSLLKSIESNAYDQFYHEHCWLFSIYALQNLLKRNKLKIINVDNTNVHGGSNIVWAVKENSKIKENQTVKTHIEQEKIFGLHQYEIFEFWKNRVEQSKEELYKFFLRLKESKKRVVGYGATSKSTMVYNYCNIDNSLMDYIVDTTPEKYNKYCPGVHIPIKKYDSNWNNGIDYAFLGAWNYAKEILEKEKKSAIPFFTHVPTVNFIT